MWMPRSFDMIKYIRAPYKLSWCSALPGFSRFTLHTSPFFLSTPVLKVWRHYPEYTTGPTNIVSADVMGKILKFLPIAWSIWVNYRLSYPYHCFFCVKIANSGSFTKKWLTPIFSLRRSPAELSSSKYFAAVLRVILRSRSINSILV